ncbi:gamma-glutamyltransferase family protein [Candidatus Palauibacter sp.]|uniref:gamma-glutamyltransferase family protein n=1 Tax=Candidatus Palauibacter sp. TaxID=3101350 RepID=UPI003B01FBB0
MKPFARVVAVAVLTLVASCGPGMDAPEESAAAGVGIFTTIAPFRSHGAVHDADNVEAMRPRIMGTHGVISSGHYLATQAGYDVLRAGGNAFDAGVTAGMALKALKMDYAGWTGVAPLILYSAAEHRVITRVGAGTSPALATLDHFLEHGKSPINNALIPADVDVWLAALDRFGTLSFGEAAQPTLRIAEEGYHLYKMQKWMTEDQTEGILAFPYNRDFWFPNGVGEQRLGDLMVNADLGRLIRYMMEAERQALAAGGSRSDGIRAARDAFYQGDPARAVDRFFREHDGIVRYEDMAGYESRWEEPLGTRFNGYDVHTGDGWSQGPRIILMLNMLENYDLRALGYNTPEYIHLISQVIDLAMADAHRYVGDPDFAPAPQGLYGKAYARERIGLIDESRAFRDMPPWGDPVRMAAVAEGAPASFVAAGGPPTGTVQNLPESDAADSGAPSFDTSSLNVMDDEGNMFSLTESDGHTFTPMIPGWGFGLGNRMGQFNLDPDLANVMAPGKRPRNTNSPLLVMKDGQPFMGLSTPGGDQQMQCLLQVFLNVTVWGMSPEQAVDQPRFGSYNFPATGSEVNRNPAVLYMEDRIPAETAETLRAMGHDVRSWGLWNWRAGAPTVTWRDPETGVMTAAGDVRRETASLGF